VSESPWVLAAREYCARGWSPIPVTYCGKSPHHSISKGWQHLRITDADLAAHFAGEPRNVGVILGQASKGLADVDLDCPESILLAERFLPRTASIFGRPSTPGAHRLYVVEKEFKTVRLQDGGGECLVELRGDGGQSVLPPSTHETGESIAWATDGERAEVLHEFLLRSVHTLGAAVLFARAWPQKGGRQDAALALGGWVLRRGWTIDEAVRFVEGVCFAAGDDEVAKRISTIQASFERIESGNSATGGQKLVGIFGADLVNRAAGWLGIDRVRGSPRSAAKTKPIPAVPPYVAFPVHVLPDKLREFVVEHAKCIGCDPAFLGVPLLGVVAAVIGNSHVIRLKRGWNEPSVVWAVVVADSGSAKSPALDAVLAPLRELEDIFATTYAIECAGEGGNDEDVIHRRIKVEDTTVEAISPILQANPRGLALCRDELSGWLKAFNQYKGGRGGDEAQWLQMHGARQMTVDRKGGDTKFVHIPRAAVSIIGGIQPGVLAASLTDEQHQSGMAARMIFAYPPRLARTWTDAEVPETVLRSYSDIVERLFDIQPGQSATSSVVPREVPLDAAAREMWIEFYNEHNRQQLTLLGNEAAAWSKLEGYAARLALVIHLARFAAGEIARPDEIDQRSMTAGVELSRWFGYEARRVYAMLQMSGQERLLLARLELVIAVGEPVSVREWMRKRSLPTADAAETELQELVDAGFGSWRFRERKLSGGAPVKEFVPSAEGTPHGTQPEGDVSVSEPPKRADCEESEAPPVSGADESDMPEPGVSETEIPNDAVHERTTPPPDVPPTPRGSDTDRTPDRSFGSGVIDSADTVTRSEA